MDFVKFKSLKRQEIGFSMKNSGIAFLSKYHQEGSNKFTYNNYYNFQKQRPQTDFIRPASEHLRETLSSLKTRGFY